MDAVPTAFQEALPALIGAAPGTVLMLIVVYLFLQFIRDLWKANIEATNVRAKMRIDADAALTEAITELRSSLERGIACRYGDRGGMPRAG